jgi:formate/nitrite transporter FocA (FNT family)
LGQTAASVATAKAAGSALPWLVKGALCNALVCLAVWLSFSARDTTGKILAILWPISTFVLLGLEH